MNPVHASAPDLTVPPPSHPSALGFNNGSQKAAPPRPTLSMPKPRAQSATAAEKKNAAMSGKAPPIPATLPVSTSPSLDAPVKRGRGRPKKTEAEKMATVVARAGMKMKAKLPVAQPPKIVMKPKMIKSKHADPLPANRGAKEIDPKNLDQPKAAGRLTKIYKLEKSVESAKIRLDFASTARRSARADWEQAVEDLQTEIREQRYGPGPLFTPDGQSAAQTSNSNPVFGEDDED